MKIRKLQLKNIGPFDDETIEFQKCPESKAEIHIFTGENGAGKTTLLMALAMIFDGRANPDNILFALQKRFRKEEQNIGLNIKFDDGTKFVSKDGGFSSNTIETKKNSNLSIFQSLTSIFNQTSKISFAAFAFSGYRQIQSPTVEALYEPKSFNPLYQALDFVKDYSQENQITINQLIANNISKSAIEKGRDKRKSDRFAKVLNSIEEIIAEITGWKIEFDMQTEPVNLVTRVNGEELDFDVLPDGLRSLISWIADLLGRVDLLKWEDDLPITEKNLILFLDEIEVHLHPAWQRKVLPVIQKLFKNSQIFLSTHSPFVVNSVDDAWVYKLELEDGKAKVTDIVRSEDGYSYETVLREIFGIDKRFGGKTQEKLEDFLKHSRAIYQQNGDSLINKEKFLDEAKNLASESAELQSIVFLELAKLTKTTGEKYEI